MRENTLRTLTREYAIESFQFSVFSFWALVIKFKDSVAVEHVLSHA